MSVKHIPGHTDEPGEVRLFTATWVCWLVGHAQAIHGALLYCRRCRTVLGFIEDEEKEA